MEAVRRLMIMCPIKNTPVFTGIAMTDDAFSTSTLIDNVIVNCSACGYGHKWNKKDAFLEGDKAPIAASPSIQSGLPR